MIVAGCVMVRLPHLFEIDESDEQRCDGKVEGKVRMADTTRLSSPDRMENQEKIWGCE